MIRFPKSPLKSLSGFFKKEDGTAAVELVVLVPVLSFITFSMVTFTMAFKEKTQAIRATSVVTDMISREVTPITPEYMTGVDALLKTLIRGDDTPNFRITAFTYDNESAQYGVAWSQDSGLYPALDDTSLNAEAHRLPLIKDGQRAILVETWIDHTPVTGDGIPGVQEFENFMVASMRFVPQLCFLPSETATVESAQC